MRRLGLKSRDGAGPITIGSGPYRSGLRPGPALIPHCPFIHQPTRRDDSPDAYRRPFLILPPDLSHGHLASTITHCSLLITHSPARPHLKPLLIAHSSASLLPRTPRQFPRKTHSQALSQGRLASPHSKPLLTAHYSLHIRPPACSPGRLASSLVKPTHKPYRKAASPAPTCQRHRHRILSINQLRRVNYGIIIIFVYCGMLRNSGSWSVPYVLKGLFKFTKHS
jgi:hypothetical protein